MLAGLVGATVNYPFDRVKGHMMGRAFQASIGEKPKESTYGALVHLGFWLVWGRAWKSEAVNGVPEAVTMQFNRMIGRSSMPWWRAGSRPFWRSTHVWSTGASGRVRPLRRFCLGGAAPRLGGALPRAAHAVRAPRGGLVRGGRWTGAVRARGAPGAGEGDAWRRRGGAVWRVSGGRELKDLCRSFCGGRRWLTILLLWRPSMDSTGPLCPFWFI